MSRPITPGDQPLMLARHKDTKETLGWDTEGGYFGDHEPLVSAMAFSATSHYLNQTTVRKNEVSDGCWAMCVIDAVLGGPLEWPNPPHPDLLEEAFGPPADEEVIH